MSPGWSKSKTDRFGGNTYTGPSPFDYTPVDQFNALNKYCSSKFKSNGKVFTTTEKRFRTENSPENKTPGPGSYPYFTPFNS